MSLCYQTDSIIVPFVFTLMCSFIPLLLYFVDPGAGGTICRSLYSIITGDGQWLPVDGIMRRFYEKCSFYAVTLVAAVAS
jgi:hypothetical protein